MSQRRFQNMGTIKDRGFASLSFTKRKQMGKVGGMASSKSGRAHRWDSKEAAAAGRIGAIAKQKYRRDRESDNSQEGE